ncbi:flavodoxin [Acetobacterium carbinolicum]|jgi:flavodoxin, short chain|uniref:flavodoxin n=1 Tax=Acetobacterium TaxID=33951 RepID=UPI000DBECC7D|nr:MULTISPECIES: flavodoxin [unclassified Acetobacterium]AWW27505.1 flavodoxin [Acetobacterium sp. KB-1]MDZ5724024.1 flavodoxin [Acetobacterium sp. K1/6]
MKKVSIVYWSGTGNTQEMAEAVAAGAEAGGAEVKVLSVDKANIEELLSSDAIALGCPSMGAEELEDQEMEPFVAELEKESLTGKPLALFGSYDWGDGQWMDEWEERMKKTGVNLVDDGLKINDAPDDAGLEACRDLGKRLAS